MLHQQLCHATAPFVLHLQTPRRGSVGCSHRSKEKRCTLVGPPTCVHVARVLQQEGQLLLLAVQAGEVQHVVAACCPCEVVMAKGAWSGIGRWGGLTRVGRHVWQEGRLYTWRSLHVGRVCAWPEFALAQSVHAGGACTRSTQVGSFGYDSEVGRFQPMGLTLTDHRV